LFDYAQKIGEVLAGGEPASTAIVPTTLSAGHVHALTALVTRGDGVTVRTTNIATILTAALPGDYNGDGTVDAADYVLWRKNDSRQAGYDLWRARFGQTTHSGSGVSANAAVPEPHTLIMLVAALIGRCIANARQSHKLVRS
jgi:hypothetical protein